MNVRDGIVLSVEIPKSTVSLVWDVGVRNACTSNATAKKERRKKKRRDTFMDNFMDLPIKGFASQFYISLSFVDIVIFVVVVTNSDGNTEIIFNELLLFSN